MLKEIPISKFNEHQAYLDSYSFDRVWLIDALGREDSSYFVSSERKQNISILKHFPECVSYQATHKMQMS